MARTPQRKLYLEELMEAMEDLVPASVWSSLTVHGNTDWTPSRVLAAAVLMGWDDAQTLAARFENVRELLRRVFVGWSPGRSYNGYARALRRWVTLIVPLVRQRLQQRVRERCRRHWQTDGWVVFAVDGSRFECPRTAANEAGLKCAGKTKTAPQIFHTTLLHLRTGTLWDFRTGPGTDSERRHFEDLAAGLPANSLVVADAGFIGFDLCRRLQTDGVRFLLRVGANVTLLTEQLGARLQVDGTTVWLWPQDRRDEPPIVLRLLVYGTGSQAVHLVTDVLEPGALSAAQARELDRQRWGIEVSDRTIKHTLDRSAWLSRTPETALAEHAATILGIWLLQVLAVQELAARRHDPRRWSAAQARDIIRRVLRRALDPTWRPPESFRSELGRAVQDDYVRRRSKRARNWPHQKHEAPPRPPRLKRLSTQQRQQAQQLLT